MKRLFVVLLLVVLAGCGPSGEAVDSGGYGPPAAESPAVASALAQGSEFPVLDQFALGLPNGCGPVAAATWLWWMGEKHFPAELPASPEAAVRELNGYMSADDGATLAEFTGGVEFFLSSRGVAHTLYAEQPATVAGLETAKAFVASGRPVWLFLRFNNGKRHTVSMVGFAENAIWFIDPEGGALWFGGTSGNPLYLDIHGAKIEAITFLTANQ